MHDCSAHGCSSNKLLGTALMTLRQWSDVVEA